MRKSSKKLFYLPGLISLVLLPVFCIPYLIYNNKHPDLRVMEMNWWYPDPNNPNNQEFPYNKYPIRKYQTIQLSKDKMANSNLLNKFQNDVRELIASKDTVLGIHLIVTDSATYGDLIQSLNILLKEKAHTYFIFANDIWVYNYFPVSNNNNRMFCGTHDAKLIPYLTDEEISPVKRTIDYTSFEFVSLAILYLTMCVFMIIKFKMDLGSK